MKYKLLTTSVIIIVGMSLSACDGKTDSTALNKFLEQQRAQMTFVQGGSFMMGPGPKEPDWVAGNNQPRHEVTISSYYIDEYLVTYKEYDFYSNITGKPLLNQELLKVFVRSPTHPVTNLTWAQAQSYCSWLGAKTGLAYDLPTEAQWEYAARSRGQEVQWSSDNGLYETGKNTPSAYQVMNQPGHLDDTPFAMAVAQFPPNPLGLYDMTGSVAQWMKNAYYPYPSTSEINPQGSSSMDNKVVRGGGYTMDTSISGVYYREGVDPTIPNEAIGFRCVINSSTPPAQLGAFAK